MMMGGARILGVFAVIPATVLLTVSFFVLVVIRKLETQALKAFGYVVAALLWLAASLVLATGMYTLSTGKCAMTSMMKSMKCQSMGEMCGKMKHHGMGQGMEVSCPKGLRAGEGQEREEKEEEPKK